MTAKKTSGHHVFSDAKEIAHALGVHKTTILRRAKRERWAYKDVVTTNVKRRLYRLPSTRIRHLVEFARNKRLNELAEAEELRQAAEAQPTEPAKDRDRAVIEGNKKFSKLAKDDPQRKRAKAREWVINAIMDHFANHHGSLSAARRSYCYKVQTEAIKLPAVIAKYMPTKGGTPHLVEPTVRRWILDFKTSGIWGLTPGYGNRNGQSIIETTPLLKRTLLALLIKYPQVRARSAKEFLESKHPTLNLCSEISIHRFFRKWKAENPQIWSYINHPDQWKSVYMAGVGSVFERIDRPNQLWELDSTPGDWMLTDGRHTVVGCIDLHSRRVKVFVSKSSTAAAVKQVLRRAMLDWGIPECIRTDNGSDYVSEEVTGLLRDLQVHQELCIPFASEEKGTIERFFRTMSHGVMNLLDGFIGHSVADRKAIESRKSFAARIMDKDAVVEVSMSSAELQEKLDAWVDHYYENNKHAGLNKKTPREVWREWPRPLRKIEDTRALDELLMNVGGVRVIGKKGIRFDNRHYFDREGVMFRHVGREVMLRVDEQDIGHLAVYLEGEFLCWAEDPDITGIDRREYALAIKRKQKKFVAAQAAELKKYTKEIKSNPAEAIIEYRKAKSENVVDLPRPTEPYTTPALEQAAISVAAREKSTVQQQQQAVTSQQQAEFIAGLKAEQAKKENVLDFDGDGRKEHAYWLRVERRLDNGEHVTKELKDGLISYKEFGLYESRQELFDSFGLTADSF